MAVVTERAGFQHGGQPDPPHGLAQRGFVVHGCESRGFQPVFAGIHLLAQTVLRIVKGPETLRNVVSFAQRHQNIARDIFEFVCNRIAAAAEPFERRRIVERRHDAVVRLAESRSVRRRIQRYAPHSQPVGLLRDHQPELAAADDADRFFSQNPLCLSVVHEFVPRTTTPPSARRPSARHGKRRASPPAPRPAARGSRRRSARRSGRR